MRLRDGSIVGDGRLDRLIHFDERSRDFAVRPILHMVGTRRRVRSQPGPTLNQGEEGACTWFSTAQRLNATPKPRRPRFSNEDARRFYWEAQKVDEWPGGAYPEASPVMEGSSVLAAMKVAQREGFISGYRWIGAGSGRVVDDLVDTLRYVGGVVLGTYWMPSMYRPRPDGVLEIETVAPIAGGHAYHAVDAVNVKLPGHGRRRLYVVIHNSWGEDWGVLFRGVGGHAFIDAESPGLEWLLQNDGEGAVPIL